MRQMDMEAPAISILVAYSSHKGAVHLNSLSSRIRCTLPDRIYSSSWLVAPRPLISRGRPPHPDSGAYLPVSPHGFLCQVIRCLNRAVPHSRLTVDSHAKGHLVLCQSKVGMADFRDDAGRRGQNQRFWYFPLPFCRVQYFLQRSHPGSHGPCAFIHEEDSGHSPADLGVFIESTSSAPTMLVVLISSISSISAAISKFIMSPV